MSTAGSAHEENGAVASIGRGALDAVLFDVDGVMTEVAGVHASAWKQMFDEYLQARSAATGQPLEEFTADDYRTLVDGKSRLDGAESFLRSRGIALPIGDPEDPPGRETVWGLGNRKSGYFLAALQAQGAAVFLEMVGFVLALRRRGIRTGAISSSRNAPAVLESVELDDLFDASVDGNDLAELGLPGRPHPAILLETARRLDVSPGRTAVVESALAGVEAGARGSFALVIGIARGGDATMLRERGADVVVHDLDQLRLEGPAVPLPSALAAFGEIAAEIGESGPVVFLDYDGTLAPIVESPALATLPPQARAMLARIAAVHPTAVISGRDLDDVRERIGLDSVYYAGCHGMQLAGPGIGHVHPDAESALPDLERAEGELRIALAEVPGALVERKRFAIAVHYRLVDRARVPLVEEAVADAHRRARELRLRGGKEVFELLPDVDWGKGRALVWLLARLGSPGAEGVPVFIGDDVTDEDGFHAVRRTGVGIRVGTDETWTLARFALGDPEQVVLFLDRLAAIRPAATPR